MEPRSRTSTVRPPARVRAWAQGVPGQAWVWFIALGALAGCGALIILQLEQNRVTQRALALTAEVQETRVELAEALVRLDPHRVGAAASEAEVGRARLRKAATRLAEIAVRADADGRLDPTEIALGQQLALGSERLERALDSSPTDLQQAEDQLESAVNALGNLADRIDTVVHRDLEGLLVRNGRHLATVLLATLALLTILTLGASLTSRSHRRSEARFEHLFDAAPVCLAYSRTDGSVERVNRRYVETFGYLPTDVPTVEAWWQQAYPEPGHRAGARAAWDAAVANAHNTSGQVAPAPFRVTTKSGAVRTGEITGIVLDEGLLVMLVDNTERDQTLASLRSHEALLEETGRIAKVGGWVFDPATGEGSWTPEVARIHEVDPAGRPSVASGLTHYVGASREAIEQAVKAAISEAQPYDLQLQLLTAAGRLKWVRTIGHPVVENGRVVRVQGSFQDVSEIVAAQEALAASEARLRSLIENASDIITVISLDGIVRYQSPAIARVLGYRPSSADGKRALDFIHPEDVPKTKAAVALARQASPPSATLEFRVRHRDGSWRWIQATGTRAKLGDEETVIVVNSRDVTAERSLQEQLLRSQRLESIGTLASGLAHDLNNVLAPIGLVVDLLRGQVSGPKGSQYLQIVETNVGRGAAIIRQLLTFGRGIGGERATVQLRHLATEMVAIMRETFPRNISVETAIAADPWAVRGDATQLHQVLMNLCVNARDAMAGGGPIRIELDNVTLDAAACRDLDGLVPGRYVRLTVSDGGPGIPAEILPRVFDPFFTTKPIGQGSGLGLSAVMGIVRSHGGDVGVRNELSGGARFTIHLPAEDDHPPLLATTQAPSTSGQGEVILVVDDEDVLRAMTGEMLEAAGYRVELAANGQAALATLGRLDGSVALVVTDLAMPVMGGLELARQVRQVSPALPFLVTTGLGDQSALRELAALGITQHLTKPSSSAALLAAVAAALASPAQSH